MSKTLKILLDFFLTLIIIFLILGDVIFVLYKIYTNDQFTEDVGYINTIESVDGNKKQVFEVEYWANRDNSGIELFELKTNYFTDYEKQEIFSLGLQFIGPIGFGTFVSDIKLFSKKTLVNDAFIMAPTGEFYVYGVDNNTDIAYSAFHQLSLDDYFTISIGEKVYKLSFSESTLRKNILYSSTDYYNIFSLCNILYNSVSSLGAGSALLEFEFRDLFNLYEQNSSGKWEKANDADTFYTYCYISTKVHNEGANSYQDSMFKNVKEDPNWLNEGYTVTQEYVTDRNYYIVTEQDFVFNWSTETSHHIGTLNLNCYDFLVKNKVSNLRVVIDNDYLSSQGILFDSLSNKYLSNLGVTSYTLINDGIPTEVYFNE